MIQKQEWDLELKIQEGAFRSVWRGQKTSELRNNDRSFQVGDKIILREYNQVSKTFSGRTVLIIITHILNISDWLTIANGGQWVILSFHVIRKKGE